MPVAVAHVQMRNITFDHRTMAHFPVSQETVNGIGIDTFWRQKITPVITEQIFHLAFVLRVDRLGQCAGCLIWVSEALLCESERRDHQQHHPTE
ncbi:hypothetical protein D3C71_1547590 [compost metagenome]